MADYKYRVLITDYIWPDTGPEREILEPLGVEIIEADRGDEDRLVELAQDVDGILTCFALTTGPVIKASPKLKIVSRYGIGVDNIAVDVATELGIPVAYVPDYCVEEVADHAMALLLALVRGINRYDPHTKDGGWDLQVGRPLLRLRGSRIGIAGFGRIGRETAKRAAAFGMDITVFDPFLKQEDLPAGMELVSRERLVAESDFITLHVPLTDETHHLIDTTAMEKMKDTALLINTCRGPVVDEYALADALNTGQIGGAGIDVTVIQPAPDNHPLRSARNCILTPHAAFCSEGSVLELEQRAAQAVADVFNGIVPRDPFNHAVLPGTGLKAREAGE